MTIYTRQGDNGQTRLSDNVPIAKDALALEACGTVDELGSAIGLVRCEGLADGMSRLLEGVQQTLLELNADWAAPGRSSSGPPAFGPAQVEALETAIDHHDSKLEPLGTFVLPGNTRAEAAMHFARTVCRRAERRAVALARAEPSRVRDHHLAYLNRLSDLLFILARCLVGRDCR